MKTKRNTLVKFCLILVLALLIFGSVIFAFTGNIATASADGTSFVGQANIKNPRN